MKALLNRRKFLKGLGVITTVGYANLLYGVRIVEAKGTRFQPLRLKAYIRSGRDRSDLSRASLKHCHRFVYSNRYSACKSLAHPGDNALVKSVYITRKNYINLFLKPCRSKAYISNLNAVI
jgi:hypothetical protein